MDSARFELGSVYLTPGALMALLLTATQVSHLLRRHVQGDFGDLCSEDRQVNEQQIFRRGRILSSYALEEGGKLWIITEEGWQRTTVLTPEEY